MYLDVIGLGTLAFIRMFNLRLDLISALVERWRSKTYTFHLSCGECMIILEDISVQLGLPVDGVAVIGPRKVANPWGLHLSPLLPTAWTHHLPV
ncbi:hypothetical protein J1N35_004334 [Gossypium stocksii]|uniref:Aminotransferase-like plant mobile domain-containing protein n=1 Tax=Gossypium stocksii TaxID=47602 RepID=A0A9D4AHK2_9ROSI|nr:hypothetical protein J1N35_004334 [Gossypium stocksii]